MVAESALPPFLLDVAAWLVTYAIHSTVLLVAALVAFAVIGRAARTSPRLADAAPAWRERIGKVALLAGIVTAGVQTALGLAPFGLRPALVDASFVAAEAANGTTGDAVRRAHDAPAQAARSSKTDESVSLLAFPLTMVPVLGVLEHAARVSRPELRRESAPEQTPVAVVEDDGRPAWIVAFVALWAFVAAAALARRWAGWRALCGSLTGSEPVADREALAVFDELCRRGGLRRDGPDAATLRVAPLLGSPVTRGIARIEICIPPRALRDLAPEELAALLGHEIAHAARRDPAWLAVFRMLEVVFCLQPLNRVVARRLEDDAELLCDDRAVVWTGDRLPLASCLTEVASWLVAPERQPRLAVGMAAQGARLSRRVERLVDDEHRPDAGARRPLLTAGALAIAASAIVVVPGFAAQRAQRPAPSAPSLELERASPSGTTDPAVEPRVDAEPVARDRAVDADAPAVAASASLADALGELDGALVDMRAELHARVGGRALEPDLDALERRVRELRARESALAASLAALEARAAHILLSPTESGRTAQDQ